MYPLLSNPHKHFYTSRYNTYGFVNHITAGIDDFNPPDSSAESTIRYGQSNTRAASWHGIVDSDTVVECLPDEYTAFHVKGYNSKTMGLEIGALSTNWDDKPDWWVNKTIRNAAKYWAPRVIRYSMPIRYALNKDDVDAHISMKQKFGFADHYMLDPGRRSDPGLYKGRNTFPRDMFLQFVREEVNRIQGKPTPKPKPKPAPKPKWKTGNVHGVFLIADRDFGAAGKLALQRHLTSKGYKRHADDGDFGRYSKLDLQIYLRDRGFRYHAIDGDFGKYSVKSLQNYLYKLGYKHHALDNVWGGYTTQSLLEALVDGRF